MTSLMQNQTLDFYLQLLNGEFNLIPSEQIMWNQFYLGLDNVDVFRRMQA